MTNAKNKPRYKLIELQNAVPHAADLASEVYQTYVPDLNAIFQPFISLSLSLSLPLFCSFCSFKMHTLHVMSPAFQ